MGQVGQQAAQQVEEQETSVTHRIFDVVPEDPEKPHVADQMDSASVEEHGGHQGA